MKAVNTWNESLAEFLNLLEDPLEWHGILFWASLPEKSPGFWRMSMGKIVPFLSPHKTIFSCNRKEAILRTQIQKLHLPGWTRDVTDDSRGRFSFPISQKFIKWTPCCRWQTYLKKLGILYIHVHVYHKSKKAKKSNSSIFNNYMNECDIVHTLDWLIM